MNKEKANTIIEKYHHNYGELQRKASKNEIHIVHNYLAELANKKMRQNVGLH